MSDSSSKTITSISDSCEEYKKLCKAAAEDSVIFSSFRSRPEYKDILEAIDADIGHTYYLALNQLYKNKIESLRLVWLNDTIGGPQLVKYPYGTYSPTTLRYFKVACDLDFLFDDISEMNVLEIGGGYGGQCVVSNALSGFKSWTIVDLPEVKLLQERYLSYFPIQSKCISYEDIDKDENEYDLIVSNYAFSECVKEVQDLYIKKYMSNNERIYMTLNMSSLKLTDGRFDHCLENELDMNIMNTRENLVSTLGLTENEEIPLTCHWNFIGTRGENKKLYE
jgi:hypothetical protein